MVLLARAFAAEGRAADGIRLLEECIARIERDRACNRGEKDRFSAPHRAALRELLHKA